MGGGAPHWTSVVASGPRTASSVADMNDRNLIFADAVEDDIGISAEPEGVNPEFFDQTCPARGMAQTRDLLLDEAFDPSYGLGVELIEVIKNRLAVSERARRIADPHIPWRLSDAATTSSGTNSPRSACARPSRI